MISSKIVNQYQDQNQVNPDTLNQIENGFKLYMNSRVVEKFLILKFYC